MPNLTKIKLNSISDQCFHTKEDSYYIIDDEINPTLDNVTTIYFNGNHMKGIQKWLNDFFLPNFK